MKAYLSYSMTASTDNDRLIETTVRHYLRTHHPRLEFYDPRVCEPEGMSMAEIQAWDFEQMARCEGLLVVWGPSTHRSGGVLEECGWARRVFDIPAVVFDPMEAVMSPWTAETVRNEIYRDIGQAVRRLTALVEGRRALEVMA